MTSASEGVPAPQVPPNAKGIGGPPSNRTTTAQHPEAPHEFSRVRLDDIDFNDLTYQLRVEMRLGDIKQSLEEAGQLEPVHLLGPAPYKIIDGFRRCTAVRALGWDKIEAAVYNGLEHRRAFQYAFAHNVVRNNLRSIDKANAIRLAMKAGLSKCDTAVELGMSEKQVGRYLALLRLPRDVQAAIDEREFTMAHALVLAAFDVGNVASVVAEVRSKGLTAAQLKRSLRKLVGTRKRAAGRPKQFVSREGNYLRFEGEFCLSAPREERERLAARLVELVALLQRESAGSQRRSFRHKNKRTREPDVG